MLAKLAPPTCFKKSFYQSVAMADEPDPRAPCTLCGCSCASKHVTEAETSKRAASLLDSDKADDQESLATERARRKLHPEAIDFLQPEFSVQRNGEQRFTVSGSFQCKGCRMTARSAPRHQDDRHKSVKVNTSKSRTLDEASEECARKLLQLHRECLPAIHFIQSADHQQSLKPEVVKDEALRRQQELENEARTLQAGCSVRLDINHKKGFEGPELEQHPSNRFAAPRGPMKRRKRATRWSTTALRRTVPTCTAAGWCCLLRTSKRR